MGQRHAAGRLNFSRDMRGMSLAAAIVFGLGACALLVATGLTLEARRFAAIELEGMEGLTVRAQIKLEALRQAADSAPSLAAFEALRQRIATVNRLDFGGAPGVVEVLDRLEAVLPDAAALAALDHDRETGVIEIVADAERSADLTSLFDRLDRDAGFSGVRLIDKKRMANDRTRVRLGMTLSPARGAPSAPRAPR